MNSIPFTFQYWISDKELKKTIQSYFDSVSNRINIPEDSIWKIRSMNIEFIFLDREYFSNPGTQANLENWVKAGRKLIMVSPNSEFAIDCIRLGFYDYLNSNSIQSELQTLIQRIEGYLKDLSNKNKNSSNSPKFLEIRDSKNIKKISWSDILFIEAYGSYSNIYTFDKYYTVSKTIKTITKDNPNFFVRIHRSFAVNLNHVVSYTAEEAILINNTKIKIARGKKSDFTRAIEKIA